MEAIGAITQTSTATAVQNNPQGQVVTKKNDLGMDEFFKLLTAQLVSQDPLKPMDDTQFISQMASFSSLAQMENIATNTSGSLDRQQDVAVQGLLGTYIRGETADGESVEGEVTRVERVDGTLQPYVGDVMVPYKLILQMSAQPFQPADAQVSE